MSKTSSNQEVTNNSTFIIEGIIIEARVGRSRYSEDIKSRIAIKSDAIPYDSITAYQDAGPRMTPAWFKDKSGYINASSRFNIPVLNDKGRELSFEDWIETGIAIGSKVRAKFTQKEGAIYPVAIMVLENGEKIDPFEGM